MFFLILQKNYLAANSIVLRLMEGQCFQEDYVFLAKWASCFWKLSRHFVPKKHPTIKKTSWKKWSMFVRGLFTNRSQGFSRFPKKETRQYSYLQIEFLMHLESRRQEIVHDQNSDIFSVTAIAIESKKFG